MILAELKPKHLRTPEIVDISMDQNIPDEKPSFLLLHQIKEPKQENLPHDDIDERPGCSYVFCSPTPHIEAGPDGRRQQRKSRKRTRSRRSECESNS